MNRTRKIASLLLRLLATALLLSALLHFVDWRKILQTLARADVIWLIPVYTLVVTRRAVEAGQLTLVLRFAGVSLPWFRVLRASMLASFYSVLTPGALISGLAKWADLSAATGNRSLVVNAMIYNRLLLDLQPLLIGAAALVWTNPTGEPLLPVAACVLAALALSGAVCLFSPRLPAPLGRVASALRGWLPSGLDSRAERLLEDLERFRDFSLLRHAGMAGIGLLAFAIGLTARVFIMKALGFSVPLATIVWVDAILIVTNHVPVTLGNFGVREGLAILVFGLYGVPADVAFAYGLVVYSCRLLLAVMGGGYQLALIAGWTTMKDQGAAS